MRYVCESCGEITAPEVIFTCGRCGHERVRPEGKIYICPECGELKVENMVKTCRKCGSGVEEI